MQFSCDRRPQDNLRLVYQPHNLSERGNENCISTISTRIAILRKFYDYNEIELKWKKIKSYIGKSKSRRYNGKKDRPYTSIEILKMLEKADERERVVILLMASTGMRVGALPCLRIRNLEKIEKLSVMIHQ